MLIAARRAILLKTLSTSKDEFYDKIEVAAYSLSRCFTDSALDSTAHHKMRSRNGSGVT